MLNKYFIFIFLLLIIPLTSAVQIDDTLFINTQTNFSVYINETVTLDAISVTDAGRIEITNPITNTTIGKFYNINATYNSTLDFFNLISALIYYENGTVLQQEFTGNLNISIPTLNNLIIMNNYNVNPQDPPSSGDPINSGGGGSGVSKVNNTLLDDITIQLTNLDNSFIFFSNGTVLYFQSGSLTITLSGNEYFYIVEYTELLFMNENSGTVVHDLGSNGNDATLTGATWNVDGVIINLTENNEYSLTSNGLFTILDLNYKWTGMTANWVNNNFGTDCPVFDTNELKNTFSAFVIGLTSFLGLIGIILGLIWLISYLKPLFSEEEGIQSFTGS